MIGELGHFALILGFLVASIQGVVPLLGAWRREPAWMAVAVSAARAQFLLMGVSYLCLTQAFVVSDFSFSYVAQNSNTALPLVYKISAVWGAHEGSLLLWSTHPERGWTFAVAARSRSLPAQMVSGPGSSAVISLVHRGGVPAASCCSRPIPSRRLIPAAPREGRDLNPLLQDIGLMAVHPPAPLHGLRGARGPLQRSRWLPLLEGRVDARVDPLDPSRGPRSPGPFSPSASCSGGSWWAY